MFWQHLFFRHSHGCFIGKNVWLQLSCKAQNEKPPDETQEAFSCLCLVGRRGFEPLISALRGRGVTSYLVFPGTFSYPCLIGLNKDCDYGLSPSLWYSVVR